MFVGILKIELRFHPVSSIKEKRNMVNSVKEKIRSRFKTAIAEVDDQDLYNSSVIGISYISNSRNHAVTKGQNIITFLESNESEIFHDYNLLVEEY
jgi:uncharacterized protein